MHTLSARLHKDSRLGNNQQSRFSQAFEDIYRETDHYSCNAPTNTEKKTMGSDRQDNKKTDNKKKREGREKINSDMGYLAPTISSFWPGSKVSCE